MKRVVVLGAGGAGKTGLAHGHRAPAPACRSSISTGSSGVRAGSSPRGKRRAPRSTRRSRSERWIIDGNFLSAGDARFERADTVVFLDLPRTTCLAACSRTGASATGADAGPTCPTAARESFDWHFYKWIWNFGRDDRPLILETLARFRGDVVELRSAAEVRSYLASVNSS